MLILFFLVAIQVDINPSAPGLILPSDSETATSEENSSSHTSSYHNSQSSTVEGSSISAITGPCYLVFESAILLQFTTCKFCGNSSNQVTKKTTGSLLQISTYCEHCLKSWVWNSQPFIGNIPAGKIITSAAILYSGSLPAKALIMKCPMITRKTFFRHQISIYNQQLR